MYSLWSVYTIADKPNILRATGGRFIEEARKIQKEYSQILLREVNVDAIRQVVEEKKVVTYDIGGNAANDEMTDEIIKKIKANS